MTQSNLYTFKVALKHHKRTWRRIEILGTQTLGDFNDIIVSSFDHDSDHLSEFFRGKANKSMGYGDIRPDGTGEGVNVRIYQLNLKPGDQIEFVYDFGDNIQHLITLETIGEPEQPIKYPRVAGQNKNTLN